MQELEEAIRDLKSAVKKTEESFWHIDGLCSKICREIQHRTAPDSVPAYFEEALSLLHSTRNLLSGTWVGKNIYDRIKGILQSRPYLLDKLPQHFKEYVE